MILSDKDIRAACEAGGLRIEPFAEDSIQPASYDLRVGGQAAISSDKKVVDLTSTGFVEIKPGDFVIVSTLEKLALDASHVGRFGLTSGYARRGLIASVGAQVDPGFRGRLFVGLTNLSTKPIALPYKDIFLTVEFHGLERPVERPYDGPYQERDELTGEDIRVVMEREYMSQTEMMRTLEALVSTVDGLKNSLNWRLPLTIGIIMGIFAIIMTIIVSVITLFAGS